MNSKYVEINLYKKNEDNTLESIITNYIILDENTIKITLTEERNITCIIRRSIYNGSNPLSKNTEEEKIPTAFNSIGVFSKKDIMNINNVDVDNFINIPIEEILLSTTNYRSQIITASANGYIIFINYVNSGYVGNNFTRIVNFGQTIELTDSFLNDKP